MGKKILKSIVVIAITFAVAFLSGVACFGRQYYSIMPFDTEPNSTLGLILIVLAAVITLTTSVFILKYFIFFTKTQVLDAQGNEDAQASRRVEIKFRLKDEEMISELSQIISDSQTQTADSAQTEG